MSDVLTHASPTSLVLRPYQQQGLDAIAAATLRGVRRQLLALPTGAGKTVIFAHLIAQAPQRTLILVHRDELIRQTLDKLTMVQVAGDIGVVKAQADHHAGDVVVASIQTLARPQRLARVAATFRLIIVDEAHHALPENTYGQVLRALGAWHADGPLVCGFTATPFRPNNTPLITTGTTAGCFEEVVYTLPLPWMIEHGYLVPIVAHGIFVEGLDLDRIRTSHGDYSADALSGVMLTADTPAHLVRGYEELTPGRRALIFCPTVAMTYAVEHAMRQAGIAAASVIGSTPVEERQAIYRQVRDGTVRALVNCLDHETEILTRRGWLAMEEMADDDITATMNLETGAIEWQKIQQILKRPVALGEHMVSLRNQSLDIRVTAGHRMVIQRGGKPWWDITEAHTLAARRGPYTLPIAAVDPDLPGVSLTDAELEFLGLFSTDGSLNKERASIEIAQAASSPVCQEIERILTACSFDWKMSEGTYTTTKGTGTYRRYRIPKGTIGGALARRGWGRLAAWVDKSLSPRLGACTVAQFERLIYGLWLGDGWKRNDPRLGKAITLYGIDWTMFDRLQAWGAVRGYATSLSVHPNTGGGQLGHLRLRKRPTVQTNNHTIPTSGGNPAHEEPSFPGEEVWCVRNQNGTIITRRHGKVAIMGQCMVLTEGFDEPSIDAIFMARPTKSKVLYTQCIGRGLRLWQGKDACLVVDAVGATKRHDLLSVAALLGLLTPKTPGTGEEPREDQGGEGPEDRETGYHAHQINLLDHDPLHWVTTRKGYWVLSLGAQLLRIRGNGQGAYRLEAKAREARSYTVIADHLSQEYCLGIAAHTAADARLEHLVRQGAGWRRKARSPAQEALAQKLGIPITADWTAGDLSDAITARVGDWYD